MPASSISSTPTTRKPKYRRQRRAGKSDLAFIEVRGQRVYLGEYGTEESKERYERTCAELRTAGVLVVPDMAVVELCDQFLIHAERYYLDPNGKRTNEVVNFKVAIRPLVKLYGRTVAAKFGPRSLEAVRQHAVDNGARARAPRQVRSASPRGSGGGKAHDRSDGGRSLHERQLPPCHLVRMRKGVSAA